MSKHIVNFVKNDCYTLFFISIIKTKTQQVQGLRENKIPLMEEAKSQSNFLSSRHFITKLVNV